MSFLRTLLAATLSGMFLLTVPLSAATSGMFPFSIETLNANHDATDMTSLNDCPAGRHGFIRAKDGHFVDGAGKRVRFLGVNLCFGAAFPSHSDADELAPRLAKLGINCVRLHHMDNAYAPRGIWDPAYPDKQHLDKGNLDKLDYLIAALKRSGIYVDLNLHVSRQFSEADGFPDTDKLIKYDKGVDNFEPRMIALQKDYARDLLTHLNPYTKARYIDEPCVAWIEINNENSLVDFCLDGTIQKIPDYYLSELKKQWNAWLANKYSSMAKLREAWYAGSEAIGANMLVNSDFSSGEDRWVLEAPHPAKATMKVEEDGPEPGVKCLHAVLTQEGLRSWDFQLHQMGLDLKEGKPYVLRFWARANQPREVRINVRLDKDPWDSVGLDAGIELPAKWKHYEFSFTAIKPEKDHCRVSFNLQSKIGDVWIAGVELRPGTGGILPDSASFGAGNIDIPASSWTAPQRADFLAFAADTERSYATQMRDFIKKTLHAKSLVVDTQVTYGGIAGLYRESLMDFGDIHAYWQHPSFPHKQWDPADWTIKNTPMVRALGQDTLTSMALARPAGKPFTVSEYNHSAPGDCTAECVPMLAAFAAQQDWDGIFLFDYHASADNWERDRISGYFDIDSNPAKIAFMPAAAAIFRRADVGSVDGSTVMQFPTKQIPDELRIDGRSIGKAWKAFGFDPRDTMTTRTSVSFTDKAEKAGLTRRAPVTPACVTWQCDNGKESDAAFIINSPASRGVIGFASGRQMKLGSLTIEPTGDTDHFAAITVVAIDGKPIEQSTHLLITAVGRVENTGMIWNADRTSVGDKWGNAPVIAEGITAQIALDSKVKAAQVYALDGGGDRSRPVTCSATSGRLTMTLGPQWKTLWYEVVIDR